MKDSFLKEQKTLLLAKESGDEHAMIRATRDLIASCVTSELDVSKLTLFDFEYLFLQIRAKSVGENIDLIVPDYTADDGGSHEIEHSMDIEQIIIDIKKRIELS